MSDFENVFSHLNLPNTNVTKFEQPRLKGIFVQLFPMKLIFQAVSGHPCDLTSKDHFEDNMLDKIRTLFGSL